MTLIQSQWKGFALTVAFILMGLYVAYSPSTYALGGCSDDATVTVDAPYVNSPYSENVLKDNATTVTAVAHVTAPLRKLGRHLGTPHYTFNLVGAQYTTTDPGPDFDWSTATSATPGTDFDTDLDDTGVDGDTVTFQFTPHVKGYWHIIISASVVVDEYSNHDVATWRHTGESADSPTVGDTTLVCFVIQSIDAKQSGANDWATEDFGIAAGNIESPAHEADVLIMLDPLVSGPVPVSLDGGVGHSGSHNAYLTDGESTVTANETETFTADEGTIVATLVSSNLLYVDDAPNGSVVEAGDVSSVAVSFEKSDLGESGWVCDPDTIEANGSADLAIRLAYGGLSMNDHDVNLYVTKVIYINDSDIEVTLTSTPDSPADLSDWATIDDPEGTTGDDGDYRDSISFGDHDNLELIEVTAYDQTVYKADE